MWTGIAIILLLVALLLFVKSPKGKELLTDEPELPNPYLFDERKDNDPVNVPIQRPKPMAVDARGRPITMPMIRWAQAQYERGTLWALNPQRPGYQMDQSYWRAVDILRAVEGGGMFLVPGVTDTFERYHKPVGQTLPAQPIPVHTGPPQDLPVVVRPAIPGAVNVHQADIVGGHHALVPPKPAIVLRERHDEL